MTTRMPTLKPLKRKPVPPDVCRLSLAIRGEVYGVRCLQPDPAAGLSRLVRLRREGSEAHYVARAEDGSVACDCGDFEFRRAGIDPAGCKHIRACRAAGLI